MTASGRRRGRIVVIGSYNRDILVRLDRFPAPGETVLAHGLMTAHGGKGSNQAVQAARCGAPVAIIAAVGTDETGAAALELWAGEGIDTRAVRRVVEPTGTAIIEVDAAGENLIVVVPGANALLDRTMVAETAATGILADAALVLAQLETPLEATLAAFRAARNVGARTLLNIAPASTAIPAEVFDLADIVVANAGEAATVTGLPAEAGGARLSRALRARLADGAAAVVTVGAEGAFLAAPEAPQGLHAPAPRVAVVDTTGAGDAFVGTVAAHLALGADLTDALTAGVVAGSLACGRRGAVPSLPDRAEIAAGLARRDRADSRQAEETRP
jgi:ribokinase